MPEIVSRHLCQNLTNLRHLRRPKIESFAASLRLLMAGEVSDEFLRQPLRRAHDIHRAEGNGRLGERAVNGHSWVLNER